MDGLLRTLGLRRSEGPAKENLVNVSASAHSGTGPGSWATRSPAESILTQIQGVLRFVGG